MDKKKISFSKISEMPEVAVAEGSMMVNKTGSWRYLRPVYREKLAPCRKGCPLGTDLPRVISLITQKKFREAWELTVETNPLPGVSGHACYHSCENSCTRTALDDRIGIQALERFLADRFLDQDFPYSPEKIAGHKAAVIGSGPSGLAAAWFLVRKGWQVEVFEQSSAAGGMLRRAIPGYKLSRNTLDREIARLEHFGVKIHLNSPILLEKELPQLKKRFDAVIAAVGTVPEESGLLPEDSSGRIRQGLEFLTEINAGAKPEIGKDVLVIGSGNTAIDSARAARRLGAASRILTLCGRREMKASGDEIKAAEAEGIDLIYQAEIISTRIEKNKIALELKGVKAPEEDDDQGQEEDRYIPNSEFTLTPDTLIEAQGEKSSLPRGSETLIARKEIFAAGDALTGSSSIAHAMQSGIAVARAALASRGEAFPESPDLPAFNLMGMNREYFTRASGVDIPAREIPEALLDFSELTETISEEAAVYESGRCISCGVCNFCDTCMIFCPDFCIHRTADGYEVDLDYCKGCGICAQECPRDVIDLIQEGS